jgi:hypothetical protein
LALVCAYAMMLFSKYFVAVNKSVSSVS